MININIKNKALKTFILFLIGGIVYFDIEVIFRGYSHWTMLVLGGLCFILIGQVNKIFSWELALWKQMLISSVIITLGEFITGCIVNLWLGWCIWDYSDMPFSILGQICLPFSLIWFFLSLVAILLDDYLRYCLFKEEKPHYKIF